MDRPKLFSRLPQSWRNLDEQGVLERYLGVWDKQFWTIQQKIDGLLETRNIEKIPDRFLNLLTSLVGHKWKDYRSYAWNRSRASHAISKYSYKGTRDSLIDLVRDHGGSYAEVVDMASKVAVWSRQGAFPADDCFFYDSDYFHPGVYQLWLNSILDIEHFWEDLEDWKPAGTKWVLGWYINDGNAGFKTSGSSTIFINIDSAVNSNPAQYNCNSWDMPLQAPATIELLPM
jgi:phage tail-like protein